MLARWGSKNHNVGALGGRLTIMLAFCGTIFGSFLNPAGCCRRPDMSYSCIAAASNVASYNVAPSLAATCRLGFWRLRQPRQRRRRRRLWRRRPRAVDQTCPIHALPLRASYYANLSLATTCRVGFQGSIWLVLCFLSSIWIDLVLMASIWLQIGVSRRIFCSKP